MGNIFKVSGPLSLGAMPKAEAEVIEERADTEITFAPSGNAVRLYVTFSKSEGEALTAQQKADALRESLPSDVVFEIKRIDETGYAAVIKTTDTCIELIEKDENVASVTIEEEAHTTVSLDTSKKNESEGFEGSKTERVEDTVVDESITVESYENDLGNLETQTVLNVDVEDHANRDLAKGPIVGIIVLAAILFVGFSFFFFKKKR
ncbi:MAG: hypothetical protein K6A29_04555 [Lachnospiraceae bacterium]|nr:hypothetical protein [Lachnospiraceae bacterium]